MPLVLTCGRPWLYRYTYAFCGHMAFVCWPRGSGNLEISLATMSPIGPWLRPAIIANIIVSCRSGFRNIRSTPSGLKHITRPVVTFRPLNWVHRSGSMEQTTRLCWTARQVTASDAQVRLTVRGCAALKPTCVNALNNWTTRHARGEFRLAWMSIFRRMISSIRCVISFKKSFAFVEIFLSSNAAYSRLQVEGPLS